MGAMRWATQHYCALLQRRGMCGGRKRKEEEKERASYSSVRVTRTDFALHLARLKRQLHDADFVALRLEPSGIATSAWLRPHPLDSPHSLHSKLKRSAQAFSLWRFGLCLFKWRGFTHSFIAYPYSFHLFPRNELKLKNVQDKFLCQLDSLELLASRGFDFNSSVHHGISYISKEFEAVSQERIRSIASRNFPCRGTTTPSKASPRYICNFKVSMKIQDMIKKWLDSLTSSPVNKHSNDKPIHSSSTNFKGLGHSTVSNYHDDNTGIGSPQFSSFEQGYVKSVTADTKFESSSSTSFIWPCFALKKLREHEVQLVKQVVSDHFIDIVTVIWPDPTFPNHKDVHLLYAASEGDKAKLMEELEHQKVEEQEKQLAKAIGFRHVVDAIVASKKIIVGHDCLLDYAHIYTKFFAPLPPNATEFSKAIESIFPCSFDTNYILEAYPRLKPQGSTKFSEIYRNVIRNYTDSGVRFNVEIAQKSQNKSGLRLTRVVDDGQKHGAFDDINDTGFDAYMSGVVFSFLCSSFGIEPGAIHQLPDLVKCGSKKGLANYANLLCWGSNGWNIASLARGKGGSGAGAPPGRNLILMWGSPVGIPGNGIEATIRKVLGGAHSDSVKVFPVDDSSAFAEFRHPEALEEFMAALDARMPGVAAGPGIQAIGFAAYERLCESSPATPWLSDGAETLETGFRERGRKGSTAAASKRGAGVVRLQAS